ncbi:tRNA (N(6)-L-threonylcarbamoyladenosine(37)-C(2))-methylthiotransferase MtaB [bacterium]|jgi:threonylcarbamoyladenosine tRNA methylthiotransferase MtaB|nr:tRNA (N(6)-L-threonylcarbamoyladenosine(37)-C(2))-methylthiotransferase MtaB [Flavobacteriaceae bacterium]MDB0068843.1 tRNA (N(6)-L-threonylcarbamoyladenosine(37)-C(2))-methylthiotransferase MtaB [Flavobacteriaceae bacterium]MDB4092861.1 tRNA (N(6)-L-threonylcarbamoyladenosine(37)-C(2))-methylthiotransferase MtaB [Flavobacteriaceae bacterium]MDB9769070.1 tRNA (N(6)-L-threonylcarbamoyladenosine(37)-C(2))-methylthiotransferase MtaB [bacterium]MDC1337417.1 tRNA (N(6)-L-threonylcarbamoyladenosin|tara:strand:+ start:122 stop:1456 length:1335 start_codon:yes stop_codon:yes gene_type:complete
MSQNHKVALTTLGCKLNYSETSTISRQFEDVGYSIVKFDQFSDIYVINTCSVTENADKQFKSYVSKALKLNPEAFLIAIGCYAQLKPEELVKVNGVDLVLGSKEKFKILDYLNDLKKNQTGSIHSCEINETDFYKSSYSIGDRTRSFLKVQDGCDYKCTYCTIPLARGISRSDKLQNIVNAAKSISNSGVKEIVLTGVNIGDYGKGEYGDKNHENTFLDLVNALDEVTGVSRIRISSIEPNLLSNAIIDFVSTSNKFVPHFHIPMQSGSDSVLKLMKRRYLTKLYRNRVEHVKKVMPNACIGADVIVGFPGESEEDFLETYNFIKSLNLSYLHVFTYSERDNTEAINLKNIVPKKIRSKRSKLLRSLSVQLKRKFYKTQLGSIKDVLFESENRNGFIYGFSNNYVRVKSNWRNDLADKIISFKLEEIDNYGLVVGKKSDLKITI